MSRGLVTTITGQEIKLSVPRPLSVESELHLSLKRLSAEFIHTRAKAKALPETITITTKTRYTVGPTYKGRLIRGRIRYRINRRIRPNPIRVQLTAKYIAILKVIRQIRALL